MVRWRGLTLPVLFLAGLGVLAAACTTALNIPTGDARWPHIAGYLGKPEGSGPFPAVVLMHGAAGIQPNLQHWSAWYRARGFVTLIVDSYGPRGVSSTVHDESNPARFEREDDAGRALDYLVQQPFVDADRVVLQGHSQGGWAVLRAFNAYLADRWKGRYVAGIAFYPPCYYNLSSRNFYAPILVLIGEADDMTKAVHCRDLARNSDKITLKVYPGVHHAFDEPRSHQGPVRFMQYTLAYDPRAIADSERQIEQFLAPLLRR
jgi:dienelactone hydrolase